MVQITLETAERALRFRAKQEELAAQNAIQGTGDFNGIYAENHRQRMIAFREAFQLVRDLRDEEDTPRRTFALAIANACRDAT